MLLYSCLAKQNLLHAILVQFQLRLMINTNTNYNILSRTEALNTRPAVVYFDPFNNKKAILEDNRAKIGIYRWNNLVTGDCYVGSSIDLEHRIRDYFSPGFLKKEIFKNKSIIYRALSKYGYCNEL